MTLKRLTAITSIMLVLVLAGPGVGTALSAKPPPSGQPDSGFATGSCRGLLTSDTSGAAHCDLNEGSYDLGLSTLGGSSAASTTGALDPTGLLSTGKAVARGYGSLLYQERIHRQASAVTVTVQVNDIDAETLANSTTVSGGVYVYVVAWAQNAYDQRDYESRYVAYSNPFGAAPPTVENGNESFTLVLSGPRLTGRINLRVYLVSFAQVGFVSCDDADDDGFCDEGTLEEHDGSGIVSATGSAHINQVTFEVS